MQEIVLVFTHGNHPILAHFLLAFKRQIRLICKIKNRHARAHLFQYAWVLKKKRPLNKYK